VGNNIIRYDVGVEAIRSCHVRAARALLDWSMLVLAESSGVSLSTVKRLEEKIAPHTPRSLTATPMACAVTRSVTQLES